MSPCYCLVGGRRLCVDFWIWNGVDRSPDGFPTREYLSVFGGWLDDRIVLEIERGLFVWVEEVVRTEGKMGGLLLLWAFNGSRRQ